MNVSCCGFLLTTILVSAGPVAPAAADAAEPLAGQALHVKTFDELQRAIAPHAAATDIQVRVRWTTVDPVANPAQTINQFELASVTEVAPAAPPRRARLHSNSLVVVSESRDGRELAWRVITDPRALRSEAPHETAPVLRGETLYYVEADLLFVMPAVADTARIRFFEPRTVDGAVVLDELGAVDVR